MTTDSEATISEDNLSDCSDEQSNDGYFTRPHSLPRFVRKIVGVE